MLSSRAVRAREPVASRPRSRPCHPATSDVASRLATRPPSRPCHPAPSDVASRLATCPPARPCHPERSELASVVEGSATSRVKPRTPKVLPLRINALNQRDLLAPRPAFELLFARKRLMDVVRSLEVHQA